jgi:hypothetical protein
MMRDSGPSGEATGSLRARIHELLQKDDPSILVRNFLEASQDQVLWQSCLTSGKLYRSLAAEIVAGEGVRSRSGSSSAPPPLGDEVLHAAQITLLSRMIPELELQYGEFHDDKASGKPDQAELWRRLWDALRRDDELWLVQLRNWLSGVGESPHQFALRVLSEMQATSPRAASTIVKSLAILSPSGDLWQLAELPGINPDFLSIVECEKRSWNRVSVAGFRPALAEAFNCKPAGEGQVVQAFERPVSRPQATSKTPPAVGDNIFRLPTGKELQDLQNEDVKVDNPTQTPSQPPTFGVSNTPVKRPKIPSWWIRCACPADHPDAGLVFEGVRWHAPVLQCPNPELRLREMKK